MLITNFGDLKAVLSTYMFHARFVPNYDLATFNFESMANRRLRVRPMEHVTTLTTANGQAALPADYLLWRTVLNDRGEELEYTHPAYLRVPDTRPPILFTIEGSTFKTMPIDDRPGLYEFHYYRKIPTITGANTGTNWLLTEHPDAYHYGALFELFALGRNLDVAAPWKQRADQVLAEIINIYALTTGPTSSKVRTAEYF